MSSRAPDTSTHAALIDRLYEHVDAWAEWSVVPSFSRFGHRLRARRFRPLPSLAGRHVVLTGASSGIGLAAARSLAGLGARLWLVGRSRARLEEARAACRGAAELRVCDLADLDETEALARDLQASCPRLHALVHNAGLLPHERQWTPQGHERAFATHVLSPYLLHEALLPSLVAERAAGGRGRVIWVSSGGMYTQHLDLIRCQAKEGVYDGVTAYAQQKRAQVMLTEALAPAFRERGVSMFAMHPGWVDTPGVSTSLPRFYRWTRPILRTPDEGADTLVWLVASDEPLGAEGSFFHDRRARPIERLRSTRHSAEERAALVALCEELLREPLARLRGQGAGAESRVSAGSNTRRSPSAP